MKTLIGFGCLCFAYLMMAVPANGMERLNEHLPNATIIGAGQMRFMFWDVYDATLYADGKSWQYDKAYHQSFALEIKYLRPLKGHKIAETSINEIKRMTNFNDAKLNLWLEFMQDIFPDVKEGDKITGLYDANGTSYFYYNDKKIGVYEDKEFGKAFFNIWFDEKTAAPSLREKLLGLK